MEKQRYALVKRNYLVPFVLVTSLFFLWGFAHAILDVLNKHFQEVLDITRTYSAMVQVLFYLGYFVMAVPAGLFITKYGYRRGVVLGLLLYGVGSLMFVPGEYWMSFEFFLLSLFVIACGLVFLETAANPYMTELGDRETAASRLNLAQSYLRTIGRWLVVVFRRRFFAYFISLYVDGHRSAGGGFGVFSNKASGDCTCG